jgi:hypothetical protein
MRMELRIMAAILAADGSTKTARDQGPARVAGIG